MRLSSCAICQVDLTPSPPASLQITWPQKKRPMRKLSKATPPRAWGGGIRGKGHGPKIRSKSITFWFFSPKKVRRKWCTWRAICVAVKHPKKIFLELFCDVLHNERPDFDLTLCCGVGWFSATICRQYVKRDMPVTINCVLLPLHSHVLLTLLSLWAEYSWLFVPGKRCGWGVMSRSYFTSCPSANTDFRETRARKKNDRKISQTPSPTR